MLGGGCTYVMLPDRSRTHNTPVVHCEERGKLRELRKAEQLPKPSLLPMAQRSGLCLTHDGQGLDACHMSPQCTGRPIAGVPHCGL